MRHGRIFSAGHREAGYHTQEWGPIPTAKDAIIGTYEGINGTLAVRHLENGPSGNPELELEWADGSMVTVLDAATAFLYLNAEQARPTSKRK